MSAGDCALPYFRSIGFIREHMSECVEFYHRSGCIDENGGFFHYYKDSGEIYNLTHRHLVSSSRFVFVNAAAYLEFGLPRYLSAVEHGVSYLRSRHRNEGTGGYAWTIDNDTVEDSTNHCYGVAFVLLAYSAAWACGFDHAADYVEETWELLERYFWDHDYGLYRDEADQDWLFSEYRGQNSNMHMCEALLAAYKVSKDDKFLNRAVTVADAMTRRRTEATGGWIWEHFNQKWEIDWDFNKACPKHIFRPWGFQAGHQIEWAKLCILLYEQLPSQSWLLPTAMRLFDTTVPIAWDAANGGLVYSLSTDRTTCCDNDKYYWVQAEGIVTAALLGSVTGDTRYWEWYEKLWAYSWSRFVDHKFGAWFRILTSTNEKVDDEKSPGGKTDYHSVGACVDILSTFRRHCS